MMRAVIFCVLLAVQLPLGAVGKQYIIPGALVKKIISHHDIRSINLDDLISDAANNQQVQNFKARRQHSINSLTLSYQFIFDSQNINETIAHLKTFSFDASSDQSIWGINCNHDPEDEYFDILVECSEESTSLTCLNKELFLIFYQKQHMEHRSYGLDNDNVLLVLTLIFMPLLTIFVHWNTITNVFDYYQS